MRITVQAAIILITERGPMTAIELAECFEVTIKRMHHSLGDWRTRKLIKRDLNDPPRYSFKPLKDIGRDEMGRLSAPKTYDPTPEEICEVLDFLYHHWGHFKEKNIRTVEKMFSVMRDFPENYETIWVMDYLKYTNND